MLRKINLVVTILMMVALLAHMILGGLELAGIGGIPVSWLSRGLVVLVAIHAVIGIILTVESVIAMKKAGTAYFKENKLFWLRRISGLVIIVALVFHLIIFMSRSGDSYRLQAFTVGYLVTQIILVLSIAVHVISNVKPTLIAFGITDLKKFSVDILLIISLALLLALIAFVIYYFRWNA